MSITRETILDFFREPFFWNIFNAHNENRFSDLWNLFDHYNVNYAKYGQSKWHSEILNLAERFMKENDEWRFLNFFKNWNPENLRTDDWKETKKNEHTYKPLATKSIKKAFEVLKTQTTESDLSWLIQTYEKAIKLFPDDDWLLREKALLHLKNNELDLAIKIYKQLVLELADKHYVWQEFSDCIISDNSLKIGILSKALSLEKNEDFLGDIHIDLAKVLIDENLFENALIELETYKKHREIKGWKLSAVFGELQQKTSSIKQSLNDNRELYKKYIPFAENFAYADFDWTELVLADKWKDDRGKERLTFTDGKTIEFTISKNRFEVLKQSELGQILKFKLHKQEIKKEVENRLSWLGKNNIIEYRYIPLIAEISEKKPWEILEDTFAVVDYINKEKNIIHAITSDNKEVFFPQIKSELQIGDFVTAKIYTKKVKDENRTELRQIQKTDKSSVISKFQTQIAIVDGVNEQKQLFHFVITSQLQGVVKYSETSLRPNEGDFIKLWYVAKLDKEKRQRVRVLRIEPTDETNQNLRKDISGLLQVKYKNYEDWEDDNIDDEFEFCEGYTSDESWTKAIREKYIYKFNSIPTQDDLNKIFVMLKTIIKKDESSNYEELKEKINDYKKNEKPFYDEKEITNVMFDKNGKLLIDNLYPDLYKERDSMIDFSEDKEYGDQLFHIALSVLSDNEFENRVIIKNTKPKIPDFAFIGDYYVPKYLLEKHNVSYDTRVKAIVIYGEDKMKRLKWKVIEIEKI